MITLHALAHLAGEHSADLEAPVAPFALGDRAVDTDREPVIMGVVNLSRDSTYRESVALDSESAVRKARVQAAQGALLVDLGAESSRATAASITPQEQIASLVPVIEQLADDAIITSIEGYDCEVVEAGLRAGARVINLTGSHHDDDMFSLAATHGASLILCHVLGAHARDLDGSQVDRDPVPAMLDQFGRRMERAREPSTRAWVSDTASTTRDPGPATKPRRCSTRLDSGDSVCRSATRCPMPSRSSETSSVAAKVSSPSLPTSVAPVSIARTRCHWSVRSWTPCTAFPRTETETCIMGAFEIVPGDRDSTVVLHVPHSSTYIPTGESVE